MLRPNEIEAANRAEVTALLVRAGYRVYRPEADTDGEDLVLRLLNGSLVTVQLKSRMTVDQTRYGERGLWMLFPSRTYSPLKPRVWYLLPHDTLFALIEANHGNAPTWAGVWTSREVAGWLRDRLTEWAVIAPAGE